MSHYLVMVVGENVTRILDPYDENKEVEKYKEECYCKGNKYFSKLQKRRLDDKDYISLDTLRDFFHNEVKDTIEKPGDQDHFWKEVVLPFYEAQEDKLKKELNKEFPGLSEEFDKDCPECEGKGERWTTYNPDSKWDWWSIGGRWPGKIILKEGGEGEQGYPSLLMDQDEDYYEGGRRVDSARIKDIDFEATFSVSEEEEKNIREFYERCVNGEEEGSFLQEFQPDEIQKLFPTVEDYIRYVSLKRFVPYATVDKDGWHAQGDMGWFDMSSESSEEKRDWTYKFKEEFLDKLHPDTLITFVDCHI